MSDFYWGLIALGVAAVCGIQLHGWWMTRRSAPRQAEPDLLRPVDGDEAAQENGLGPGAVDSEPDLGALFDGATRFMVPEPARRPAMDALIDLIANIEPEMPQNIWSGDAVLAALPATNRVGSKPFSVEGFNPATGSWEVPMAGARYIALQAGVQLANRSGAPTSRCACSSLRSPFRAATASGTAR
jgi:hypothetical protein